MRKTLIFLSIYVVALTSLAAPDFYLRGFQNNWVSRECPRFVEENGVYFLHVDMLDETTVPYGFKISTGDDVDEEYIVDGFTYLDQLMKCVRPSGSGNNINLPAGINSLAGATLIFNYRNATGPTLRIVPDLYLAGEFNNWNNQDQRYKFSEIGNGYYSLVVPAVSAGEKFRIAAGAKDAWTVEYGGELEMEPGKTYNLFAGPGNDMTVSKDLSNALIIINRNNDTIIINPESGEEDPGISDNWSDKIFYLTGEFNGWNNEDSRYQFRQTAPFVYTLSVNSLIGDFKIVADGWEIQYGGDADMKLGQTYKCVFATQGSNMTLKNASYLSDIKITFDYKNLTVSVDGVSLMPAILHLVGDFNDWEISPVYAFTYYPEDNKYVLRTHNFSGKFKVVSDDEVYIFGGSGIVLDKEQSISHESESMSFDGLDHDGRLKITVFPNSNISTTNMPLENVEPAAPVEYYNLQGIKVSQPEKGIYIKRRGSKSEKILIR